MRIISAARKLCVQVIFTYVKIYEQPKKREPKEEYNPAEAAAKTDLHTNDKRRAANTSLEVDSCTQANWAS